MLRGRHRGLPVALDRAVMLPQEFKHTESISIIQPPTPANSEENIAMDTPESTQHSVPDINLA